MVTRQCIVLHPWFRSGIRRNTSNLFLLLLLLDCLPLLLGSTHLVLQLLDLAHLGVDQQVIGRLLLLRELHHKGDNEKGTNWFPFHFCVSTRPAVSGRLKTGRADWQQAAQAGREGNSSRSSW